LPERITEIKDRAYAVQHFQFSKLAWQLGSEKEGKAEFASAVRLFPGYMSDLDAISQLACAHQGQIASGTEHNLDLDEAERTVIDSLEEAYEEGAIEPNNYDQAMAWNYYALGRLAYYMARDSQQARRFLKKSIMIWPSLIWHSDVVVWLARSILGYDSLQSVKSIFGRS
jgi:tetratricopeptide (TPR) repeat protein